jgi:WD40 repeat protein
LAYDAFMSYSHAADGELAPALQAGIQRLAKPWYRPRALREAEWFVLLASPEAVASDWVGRELAHWLANNRADRLLPVVTGGTWAWDAETHALTGTAVLPALRDAFSDEPRHLDLRWARTETDLDMHNPRFRDAVAQLAAPMHGLAKDDLESEDVRLHRHARRLARGAVSILVVLVIMSLVFGSIAFVERGRANRSAAEARSQRDRAQAERFAALSTAKTAGAADQALLLAVEGYQRSDSATTRAALLAAVTAEPLVGYLPGPHDSTTSTISPDGKVVVAGTVDGSVRFWSPDDPPGSSVLVAPPSTLKRDKAVAMTFNQRGNTFFVLHEDGQVQVWDARSRKPEGAPMRIGKPGALTIVASPDGRTVAVTGLGEPEVSSLGQQVALYDVVARRSLGTVPGSYDAAFSSDGKTLYAWDPQGVTAFDVRTRTQRREEILASPNVVQNIAAATDARGRRLLAVGVGPGACGSGTCGASLVDTNGGQLLGTFASNLSANAVAISKDGTEVVIGATDGSVTVWLPPGTPTGLQALIQQLQGTSLGVISLEPPLHQHSTITRVSLAAAGQRLVSTAADGTTVLWDLSGAGMLATGPLTSSLDRRFVLSPTGSRLAAAGEELRIWSIERDAAGTMRGFTTEVTRSTPRSSGSGLQFDPAESTRSVEFDPAGASLVHQDTVYTAGTKRRVPDALVGKEVIGASDTGTYAFVVSDAEMNSRLCARCSGTPSALVAVDIWAGREIGSIRPEVVKGALERAHRGRADNLSVQPISLRTIDGRGQLMVDAQGGRAATISSFGDVVVWDLRTGEPVGPPIIGEATTGASAVAFALDGSELAVGRRDGTILRYAVPSLRPNGTVFGGHAAAIGQIAYQPKGSLLAAASAEVVDVFDLASGANVPVIRFNNPGSLAAGLTRPSGIVQFDATGRVLLTNGYLTTRAALLWSMVPKDWTAVACRAAGRNLSRAEWTQLVGTDTPYHATCQQWPAG